MIAGTGRTDVQSSSVRGMFSGVYRLEVVVCVANGSFPYVIRILHLESSGDCVERLAVAFRTESSSLAVSSDGRGVRSAVHGRSADDR